MPESSNDLPLVQVLKGTINGAISNISLDFTQARELRDPAIASIMRALAGDPVGFGEASYTPVDHNGLFGVMLALQRPTRDEEPLDSLLRVVAGHIGYRIESQTRSIDMFKFLLEAMRAEDGPRQD